MNPFRSDGKPGQDGPPAGVSGLALALGEYTGPLEERIRAWERNDVIRRFWSRDPSLWAAGPVPEIGNRLGWLGLPETMEPRLGGISAFAREIKAEGFTDAVLLGMGGSSLAPEVFQKTFGRAHGYPELTVLDSTHPAAVEAVEREIDLARTMFIVSSKSGTTIEPLSFFRYFWSKAGRLSPSPGRQFVAITDPGTPLAALARDRNFRRVFEALPDVGGRYSGLTEFGLVPAALIGLDIGRLLAGAREEARANAAEVPAGQAPGFLLGAALGETAGTRDKLTILTSPSLRSFPDWLEQLIAESTGKDGKGIVPVAGEPPLPAGLYGRDRIFVSLLLEAEANSEAEGPAASLERAGQPVIRIRLKDLLELGGEIFRWELAVAAAGAMLGIQPFNQPDVELAKELARKAMTGNPVGRPDTPPAEDAVPADDPRRLGAALGNWLARAQAKDYISIQAYLAPDENTTRALQDLRLTLLRKTGLATTLGYGPRFLHSTGQLHKGGPNEALVLQLIDEPRPDLAVPESDFTFGALIGAQALGDYQALRRKGRRIVRVNLKNDSAGGIRLLQKWAGIR